MGGGNKAIVSHKSAIMKYYITAEEAMKLTTKKEKIIRDEQKNIGPPLLDSSLGPPIGVQRMVSDGFVSELMRLLSVNASPDYTSEFVGLIQESIVDPEQGLSVEELSARSSDIFGKELTDIRTECTVTDPERGMATKVTFAKFDSNTDVTHTQTVLIGRNTSLNTSDSDSLKEVILSAATDNERVIKQEITIAMTSSLDDEGQFDAFYNEQDLFSLLGMNELLEDSTIGKIERSRSLLDENTLQRSVSIITQKSTEEALGAELNAGFSDVVRNTSNDSNASEDY